MEELTQDGAQLTRTMLMSAAQLAESMARVQAQRAWMAQNRATAQAAPASWAEHDPEARAAMQLIKQHAEARWGRDPDGAIKPR